MRRQHPLTHLGFEKLAGIYVILNKLNQKRYIGSTKDFKARCRTHWWHLNKGDHHSAYLQCAWNKYGGESFDFIILEVTTETSKENLLRLENEHMKRLKPEYNMSETAEARPSKQGLARRIAAKRKEYVLTSPTGEIVEVSNLKGFCLDNGLEYKYMSAAIRGRQGHHKGWKGQRKGEPFPLYEYHQRKLKRLYKDGKIYEFRDHRRFAAEHGMKPADVANVLYGNAKVSHGFVLPPEVVQS